MTDSLLICNRALWRIGHQPLSSLDDPGKTAETCRALYPDLRDALLQAHPWNFAQKRVQLTADVEGPVWGPRHAYTLPPDCLQVEFVNGRRRPPHSREGRHLLSDLSPPIDLRYTARITDPGLFPPLFVETLVARLAAELAEPIAGSSTTREMALREYNGLLTTARSRDAQEDIPQREEHSDWILTRH